MSELRRRILLPGDGDPIVYPTKGQIITMNMDGTNKNYRVLSISDSKAVLVFQGYFQTGLYDSVSSGMYSGSTSDVYYNTTYYNSCTALMDYSVQVRLCGSGTNYISISGIAETISRKIWLYGAYEASNYLNATYLTPAQVTSILSLATNKYYWIRELYYYSNIYNAEAI